MKFSQETLMAYADGELDAATRRAVEEAMVSDARLAQQIEQHHTLRAQLDTAYGGIAAEPVPQRLITIAQHAPAGGEVVDLSAARSTRGEHSGPRRWSWPQWTSIAASLVIGVLGGRFVWHTPGSDAQSMLVGTEAGHLIARGQLAAALSKQPAGVVADDETVSIGFSFRAKSGEYCRTFSMQQQGALAGFACREADAWRVRALAHGERTTPSGRYRMAGAELPAAILTAIDATIAGEALDAQEEGAARERGWRNTP